MDVHKMTCEDWGMRSPDCGRWTPSGQSKTTQCLTFAYHFELFNRWAHVRGRGWGVNPL